MTLRILPAIGLAACLSLWQQPALADEKVELCDATPFKERLAQAATRHLVEQGAAFKRFGVHAMPAEDLGDNYPPGTWIVYFSSSFRCGELGLDGGGWEVAIDPKTLKVLKSFHSPL
ncbi:hypothetical protein [Taklimakanibacter albus]|uniref:Uncharacterized protein n=1 Tax=Taklimakanibacter albus TaxID=2800327 RepID=A0ACC5RDW3_9HYPH|nr:hypothetical protein [Aestuariivirga sp. YIM B02566]MBK1870886.1 hypothetical protein [Aestuariivirga sp. YIM B02566]